MEDKSRHDAFEKDPDGKWRCVKPVTVQIENRMIVISAGMTFTEGELFLGIDVAKYLKDLQS